LVLAARLGFFLVPVAAAEASTNLSRAAALGRRNTWRLLVICSALTAPVLVLLAAVEFLVLGAPVRANLLHAVSAGMPDRALEILASHAPAIAAIASIAVVGLLALIAGASAVAYRDRCDDVPLHEHTPAARREPRETRDVSAPLIGVGRAPAFANIHPLATLLPSEMPNMMAHIEPGGAPPESVDGGASAMQANAGAPLSTAGEQVHQPPEQPETLQPDLPPLGESANSLVEREIIQAAEHKPADARAGASGPYQAQAVGL
jgi:hypothetical protein